MSRFNQKTEKVVKRTTTLQGGSGFTQDPINELIGLLSTGLDNTYYEKLTDREKRFTDIFNKVAKKDPTFAAKALVYARTKFGQRTVTHYGAVELIKHLTGTELGKRFFSKRERKQNLGGIVYRLDDMTEILACYLAQNGGKAKLPNALKKGFKDAIEHADAYQLAKYQMKGKTVSLVDIVNLVHPKETDANGLVTVPKDVFIKAIKGTKFAKSRMPDTTEDGDFRVPALKALVLGILKQFNTVEDKNTKAGKEVSEKVKSGELSVSEAATVLNEAKTDNFAELIKTKKIGYLALLRNLRNIIKTGDNKVLDMACELLVDSKFIKSSLVFPHQIDLALEIMMLEFRGSELRKVAQALDTAYLASIPNLTELFSPGKTAVVSDTSGSMQGGWGQGVQIGVNRKPAKINSSPVEKAALISATLAKGLDADLYQFGTRTAEIKYNPLDSINTIKSNVTSQIGRVGHGTVWRSILPELDKVGGKYDRIFIISDEQGGDGVEASVQAYKEKYGMPHIYCINLCGYAPVMLKQSSRVHRIYGYGADIYETAKKVELDPKAIINEIKEIVI